MKKQFVLEDHGVTWSADAESVAEYLDRAIQVLERVAETYKSERLRDEMKRAMCDIKLCQRVLRSPVK